MPPVDEAGLLASIGRALVSTAEVRVILADVCRTTAQLCGGDRCAVYLIDPEAAAVVPAMSQFADGRRSDVAWKQFRALARPLTEMRLTNRVMTTGQAVVIDDARTSDDIEPAFVELFGSRSVMNVPVALHGRVIGTLGVDTVDEVRPFGPRQVALAQTVADQLALFVHTRILAERLERRLRDTEGLLTLAEELGGSLDRAELARRAAREVTRLFDADTSIAFQLDGERGTGGALAGYHVPDSLRGFGEAEYDIDDAAVSGAVAEAFATGAPLACADTAVDDRFHHPFVDLPQRPRGFVLIPMLAHGRAVGALVSYWWDRPHAVTEGVLRLAAGVASQMSLALHNAVLYEEATQALDDLERAQDELVRGETLRALGELAGGTAHHINNMLAVVIGRVHLLLDTVKDESVRRPLRIIERAALDGADVVRRVAEFARTRPASPDTAVDLRAVVREAVEMTRDRWESAAPPIEIVQELDDAPPVGGNASALRGVVTNLLLNAIEALPGGGRVVVRTREAGAWTALSVHDTGVGMTPDVRRRAFEPFFTTKGARRTGLGLSATYGVVSAHGGLITIDSAPGTGTTITVQLPAPLLPEEAPRPSDAGALRILVVDADARAREGIRDTLRGEGHAVVTAGSAAAAVEYLGTGLAVDVVLTTSLRDASDASLATVVKERWPSLVVGVLRDADERSGEPAADFVLAKPVDPGALAAALAEHARPRPRWTEDRGAGPGLPWRPS